jgi:hypothetical protein
MSVILLEKNTMDLNKITELVFNLSRAYETHKKGKIINNHWVITDTEFYNKHKNKIIINYAKYGENKETIYGAYTLKDNILYIETKKYYGIIKYNTNFIAVVLSETEYGLYTNIMTMLAVNTKLVDNYNKLNNEPPKLENILKIMKWKITKKALQNIKDNI